MPVTQVLAPEDRVLQTREIPCRNTERRNKKFETQIDTLQAESSCPVCDGGLCTLTKVWQVFSLERGG